MSGVFNIKYQEPSVGIDTIDMKAQITRNP